MMKFIYTIIIAIFVIPFTAFSQNVITGVEVEPTILTSTLDANVSDYNIYQIDILKSDIKINSNRRRVELNLGNQNFILNLYNANLSVSYESENLPQLFGGSLNTGGTVSLTVNNNFIYGFIRTGSSYKYIEPLNYFEKGAANNLFVVYEAQNVIDTGEHVCGVTESERKTNQFSHLKMPTTDCKIIDFGIANDYEMYQAHGNSTTNVENHNLGVLNNVQTNYRSEFDDNLEFDVVAHFIPTSNGADPFTNSTDALTLLNSFTNWADGGGNSGGSSGGFSVDYNQATLWTDRNICSGGCGTVGLAWFPGWHSILEDYTTSAASLMSLMSHELGHNYDAPHDGTGTNFIMAPSVTITTAWSSLSKTDINARLATLGYLSNCSTMGAPNADFFQSAIPVCTNETVEYEDQSQYGATRTWDFFSGTPATSTDAKETVTYNTVGLDAVKIISSNAAGSDSTYNYVHVQAEPTINCSTNSPNGGTHGGISGFFLENISNSSSGSSSSNEYENFICEQVATLAPSTTYDFSATIGSCSGGCNPCELLRLYIDYNGDGDFNDTGELAYTSGGSGWCGTQSHSFTTPSSPQLAETLRLRLISDNNFINSPCHNPTTGETEDYGVYFPETQLLGCTDPAASNYDPLATIDDGTCEYGGTTWYRDFDSDSFGDINVTQNSVTQPAGYVADSTDCDDTDGTVYPGAPELCDGQINNCNTGSLPGNEIDNDGDQLVECSIDPGGWDGNPSVIAGDDCDDTDATIYPGAPELCDGQINNCNTGSLPGIEVDNDGDQYVECAIDAGGWDGPGSVIGGDDCDDTDNTVYPGAPELCDGQINNCNTGSLPGNEVDNDGDQYVECTWDAGGWDGSLDVIGGDDCDDTDNTMFPGNPEICDGKDNDCDGQTDEGIGNLYYEDSDNDGFGNLASSVLNCSQPAGYVSNSTDCDDTDGTVYPNAPELCDGQINDCNQVTLPLNEVDIDSDMYVECDLDAGGWDGVGTVIGGGDCDETNPAINPGATEVCDGVDNNCDTVIDEGCGVVCDGDYLVINTITQNTYRAEINIYSDALVNNGQSILFTAGTDIDLDSDFEVVIGTQFEARIEDCIPGSVTEEEDVIYLRSSDSDELITLLGDHFPTGNFQVEISDGSDNIVLDKAMDYSMAKVNLSKQINDLSQGIYLIKFFDGNKTVAQRIAVIR